MPADKYNATWASHSSITDYLNCPRAYFLKNLYRNPQTGHKMTLMSPALALGQSVHSVLEALSFLPTDRRFDDPLSVKFEEEWQKVSGERGGFFSDEVELCFKKRGLEMLTRVYNNQGPLRNPAVKISQELPQFWLSEEDTIILCGKIDWLEYIPSTDSVHIIDFKTGQKDEDPASMQLFIYHLLVHHCQKRDVSKASFWYLERDNECHEVGLPDLEESQQKVLSVARKMKLAKQLKKFDCPKGDGCFACAPMEKILQGKAKCVGEDHYHRDIYALSYADTPINTEESVIL